MDMMGMLFLVVAIALVPVALFFGLIGLGVFVWTWRRIGPYFVDFGRWMGNWRNYIPCGCLLLGGIVLLVAVAAVLPEQLDILRVVLLVLVAVVFFTASVFAVVLWAVRLSRWLWPRFRKGFWDYLERLYHLVWRGVSGEGRAATRGPARGRRQPAEGDGAAEPAGQGKGRSTVGVVPAARMAVPARRSSPGVGWLWGVLWGRPQRPVRSPKPMAKSPEAQPQHVAAAESGRPPRVPTKPKTGLRPLMWRLGMLGRTKGVALKPKAGTPQERAPMPAKRAAPVSSVSDQPRPSVTVAAPKPAEAKSKPTIVVGPKAKRGVLGAIGGFGRSIARGLERLRNAFWAGVFRLLRLLRLSGKKK